MQYPRPQKRHFGLGTSHFLAAFSARSPSFSRDLVLFGSYFDKVTFISRDLPSRDRISGRWRSFFGDLVLFSGFFSKVPFKAGY